MVGSKIEKKNVLDRNLSESMIHNLNKNHPFSDVNHQILEESEEGALKKISEIKTKRKVWAGGQYQKPKEGSNFQRVESIRTSDFLTLLRKTTCAVLSNQGFIIREIFVDNGNQIALVLTLTEHTIAHVCCQFRLKRPTNIGMVDLPSLEPVDERFRPLRTNEALWDEKVWEKLYVKDSSKADQLRSLRTIIMEMLEGKCNMKQIVRMAGGVWNEERTDFVHEIYDHEVLDIKVWKEYACYLVRLGERVVEIERLKYKVKQIVKHYYTNQSSSGTGLLSRKKMYEVELNKFICGEIVRAIEESMKVEEDPKKRNLKNMWERLGVEVPEYGFTYRGADNSMKPRNRMLFSMIWKDYLYQTKMPLNEDCDSTSSSQNKIGETAVYHVLFSKLERLKAVDFLVDFS